VSHTSAYCLLPGTHQPTAYPAHNRLQPGTHQPTAYPAHNRLLPGTHQPTAYPAHNRLLPGTHQPTAYPAHNRLLPGTHQPTAWHTIISLLTTRHTTAYCQSAGQIFLCYLKVPIKVQTIHIPESRPHAPPELSISLLVRSHCRWQGASRWGGCS